jgi:hypothetical protein
MTSQESIVETENAESAQPTEAADPIEVVNPIEEDTSVYLADVPLTPPPRPSRSMGMLTTGLVVVVVAGLGFLGGVKVQQHQAGGAGGGAAGFAGRLPQRPGGTGAAGTAGAPGAAGGAAGAGGATVGTVKLVDGNVIYVTSVNGDVIKIRTSAGSTVTKSSTATVGDIRPGDSVLVQGEAGSDGTIAATRVTDNGAGGAAGGFGGAGGGGGFRGGGIAPGG